MGSKAGKQLWDGSTGIKRHMRLLSFKRRQRKLYSESLLIANMKDESIFIRWINED